MNKYIILITFLLLNSSLVMSQKYETQEYQVIDQIDKIEIRYYPSAPMIRVSSNQSRNNNFGKLFRYIAGNNNNEEKIAMTTPVYMSNQSKTMEFVLPKRFLSGDIPVPNDNDVETYISEGTSKLLQILTLLLNKVSLAHCCIFLFFIPFFISLRIFFGFSNLGLSSVR